MPLVRHVPAPYTAETIGAVSQHGGKQTTGYLVDGKQAVTILATKAPWAAAWWREHAPHVLANDFQFLFPSDVCEPV
jgi:hypothetical protein